MKDLTMDIIMEEVENLTDDLFQEEDIAYSEEAIEREMLG